MKVWCMWCDGVMYTYTLPYAPCKALWLCGLNTMRSKIMCMTEILLHQEFKLKMIHPRNPPNRETQNHGTNSNWIKIWIQIYNARYRGILVSRFGWLRGFSFWSGNYNIWSDQVGQFRHSKNLGGLKHKKQRGVFIRTKIWKKTHLRYVLKLGVTTSTWGFMIAIRK